jgi:murein DD-endopeptidase MepM/ murein hydrolase activator NlpD
MVNKIRVAAWRHLQAIAVVCLAVSAAPPAAGHDKKHPPAGDITVADQLDRLARGHGIVVNGINRSFGIAAPADGKADWERLGRPHSNFDQTTIRTPGGAGRQVTVIGPRQVPPETEDRPAKSLKAGRTDPADLRRALMGPAAAVTRVSSGYGRRKHPIFGYSHVHGGIDFAAPKGTPVAAVADGEISLVSQGPIFGKYLRVRHDAVHQSGYAHLSRFAKGLRKGSPVTRGQIIGYVGSTGRSTGPHLHFEVLKNGERVDPRKVAIPDGGWSERIKLAPKAASAGSGAGG